MPALGFLLLALLPADAPIPSTGSATVRAVWLADPDPATVKSGTVGRWVFVPGSRPDDVTSHWCVEAAGAHGDGQAEQKQARPEGRQRQFQGLLPGRA